MQHTYRSSPVPGTFGVDLRNGAVARLAVPDANGVALDAGLSAECADVLGVLGDFHLLHRLSEGSTISLHNFCQFLYRLQAEHRHLQPLALLPALLSGGCLFVSRYRAANPASERPRQEQCEGLMMMCVGGRSGEVIGLFVPGTVFTGD